MVIPSTGRLITQYGVQTPNSSSSSILMVTTDRAEAEHWLDSIIDGSIVQRTISYSSWQREDDDGDLALTG